MNFLELLQRATPSPEPLLTGEWATIAFRPDLGSQQEFIVGVAAAIDGEAQLHPKWLPSLSKLSHLYGDAITSSDTRDLFEGSEIAIRSSYHAVLKTLDSGSPHLRVIPCGYLATHDIDVELTTLLKRQGGALWQDSHHRDSPMDDEWAYTTTMRAVKSAQDTFNPFIPGRSIVIGTRKLSIALNNGQSYGNIVSARYALFSTIHGHIHSSLLQVTRAHNLSDRQAQPALFVVLPEANTPADVLTSKKTIDLLNEIEEAGVAQFSHNDPAEVALKIQAWAAAA
ncbi:hypothetical protein [Massilia sp. CCM 8734]|uniref:hypothetical protein n=1 Tax=Massilia sp. CCM 8734 TaxID=2609283 RepID=UPI001422DA58|nr:hypothetical protein [Massilia sp. CCM 8734]NHZ99562.1 hypothetical protein [Massilia sp. CCM 8734]